jgi:hypothetical protein
MQSFLVYRTLDRDVWKKTVFTREPAGRKTGEVFRILINLTDWTTYLGNIADKSLEEEL